MARLVGINHVALEVGNIDEALEFYGSLFDFELRGRVRGMAFLDMGDQFLALSKGGGGEPDAGRHFGLVVDDREAVRAAVERSGAEIARTRGLRFRDPWGNNVEVVEYGDIQFLKDPEVLAALGLEGLEKSEDALRELEKKGLRPARASRPRA